jgi:hypothetical protein
LKLERWGREGKGKLDFLCKFLRIPCD